jgi:hypothetical protein
VFEKQTSAVTLSMSEQVTVSHCTAHRGPRAAFNVCEGAFGGHVFEFNDVFDQVRETQDHGPFNSWGRDRFFGRGFSAADQSKYALLDHWKPNIIRNNRIGNLPGTSNLGVDLDDGSTNYQIYDNLLINVTAKSADGYVHSISNNIVVGQPLTFHSWNTVDMRKFVTHNIIVNPNPYYARSPAYLGSVDFAPNTGRIDSNLFWNNGKAVTLIMRGSGENVDANPTWQQYGLDPHSRTADPQFTDPATCNYQVKAGSPALALGFHNFPMDQFGKPGYPAYPGCKSAVTALGKPDAAPGISGAAIQPMAGGKRLGFILARDAKVNIRVYSIAGRLLARTGIEGRKGANTVAWEAFGPVRDGLVLVGLWIDGDAPRISAIVKASR